MSLSHSNANRIDLLWALNGISVSTEKKDHAARSGTQLSDSTIPASPSKGANNPQEGHHSYDPALGNIASGWSGEREPDTQL